MLTEDLKFHLEEAVLRGLFTTQEIADHLQIPIDKFNETFDTESQAYLRKLIVDNKAALIGKVVDISNYAELNRGDEIKIMAIKFLLSALHNVHEKSISEKQINNFKIKNLRFNQILKAAQMSTAWGDDDVTQKFIKNVERIEEVLK